MFIEILDRLKGERGPLLPKKKPEKELKKIRDANFEKAKPALENPDEVKEMFNQGGPVGRPGGFVEEGVMFYGKTVPGEPNIYPTADGYRVEMGSDDPKYGNKIYKTGFKTLKDAKKFRQSVLDKSKKAQKGYLTPVEFSKELEKYKIPGLNLKNFKNTVRLAKSAGIKTIPDTRVYRKGSGGTKFLYEPPNKEIVEKIKQNLIKAPATPYGKMMFEKRLEYAKKLLKTGKYTRVEVDQMVKDKFGIGMKTMIEKEARKLGDLVPLGTGEGGTVDKKIKKQLRDLDNSKVKKILAGGESNIPKITKAVKEVIDVDDSLALRRVGQLIEEYAGRNRYLPESFKNDKIIKATGKLRLGLGEIDSSRLYGGIGGGLQRKAAEETFAKEMDMKGSAGKGAVSQTKRKIADLLPREEGMSKYQTDMVKNIRSGYRFNSLPYSVFAQGLREDINQRKGVLPKGESGISLDRQTSLYENRIQKAKSLTDKKKLASEYNKIAKDFAKKANKNLKKGQLPVRVLEFSFDPPKEAIKNKAAYEKYGDKFDEVYKRHGYSFKVPSDLKTLDQSLEFVKRPVGQAKIATAAKMGSPRAYSELIPGSARFVEGTGKFLKSIPQDFTQGRKLRGVGKVLGVAALPLEAYLMKQMYDQGYTPGEILLSPLALDPVARAIRRRMRMSPVERQALTRQMIDSDESGLSSDFYTPYLEGSETVDPDAAMQKQIDREISDRKALAEERAEPFFDDSLVYNFKEGGPVDPSKRKFMKLLAGIASIPFVGKYLKLAEPASKVGIMATEGAKLGVEKLMMLINKIKKLGTSDKPRQTQDLQEVTIYKGKDGSEYELVEDLATGDVRVTKDKPGIQMGGDKAYDVIEDRSSFTIKKGRADETTKGKKPPDEYDEMQEVPSRDGTFDDFDDVSDQTIKEIDDELNIKKGFYKGGLTDTTPPKRGPMSQGIAEAYQNL